MSTMEAIKSGLLDEARPPDTRGTEGTAGGDYFSETASAVSGF
jgi:hypothetical protein